MFFKIIFLVFIHLCIGVDIELFEYIENTSCINCYLSPNTVYRIVNHVNLSKNISIIGDKTTIKIDFNNTDNNSMDSKIKIKENIIISFENINFTANQNKINDKSALFLFQKGSSKIILIKCVFLNIIIPNFIFFNIGSNDLSILQITNCIFKNNKFGSLVVGENLNIDLKNLIFRNNTFTFHLFMLKNGNSSINKIYMFNNIFHLSFYYAFNRNTFLSNNYYTNFTNFFMNENYFKYNLIFLYYRKEIKILIFRIFSLKNTFESNFFVITLMNEFLTLDLIFLSFANNSIINSNLIEINLDNSLELNNIVFIQKLNIQFCVFQNLAGDLHGSIYTSGTINIYFLDLTILYNSCINQGCGIYCFSQSNNSNYRIIESKFFKNLAEIDDLYYQISFNSIYLDTKGLIMFYNTVFLYNRVSKGGNPCFSNTNTKYANIIIIVGCKFIENYGDFSSSCLKIYAKILSISDSIFYSNVVSIFSNEETLVTGVLFLIVDQVNLESIIFYNNNGKVGSAIYFNTAIKSLIVIMNNCVFYENFAVYSTLAFYPKFEYSIIDFNNCSFFKNFNFHYGIIYINSEMLFIFNVNKNIFYKNEGELGVSLLIVDVINSNISIVQCFFLNNHVIYRWILPPKGGLFYCSGELESTIIIFEENIFAYNYGYTNFLFSNELCSFKFNKCLIKNNSGVINGIGLSLGYSSFEFNNSLVLNNLVERGVLLEFIERSNAVISNNRFVENYCQHYGIFKIGQLAHIFLNFSIFSNNKGNTGTILFAFNCFYPFIIQNCYFSNNIAKLTFFEFFYSDASINNIHFYNNTGGLFEIRLSNTNITNSFIKNHYCSNRKVTCLFDVILNSKLFVLTVLVQKITSQSNVSSFMFKSSKIFINNSVIKQISIRSRVTFFNGLSSDYTIANSLIFNFTSSIFEFTDVDTMINKLIYKQYPLRISSKPGFLLSFCNRILINLSTFRYFTRILNGGGVFEFFQSNINITNSYFLENKAINGGSLIVNNSNITIIDSIFIGNQADFGGAIYFSCNNKIICIWSVKNNTFEKCDAKYAGGAYFWDAYQPFNENSNIFINNKAISGNNLGTPPLKFSTYYKANETQESFYNSINKYLPGKKLMVSIRMKLIDFYNQSIDYPVNGKTFIEIFRSKDLVNFKDIEIDYEATIIGETIALFDTNDFLYIFDNIQINSKNGYGVILSFSTYLINVLNKMLIYYTYPHYYSDNKGYQFLLYLNFSICPLGYINNPTKKTCIMCFEGEYSLNQSDVTCRQCPSNAKCKLNGSFIDVNTGYWRSSYFSTNIYKCRLDSCLGADQCKKGYVGPLCDTCLMSDNEHYYKGNDNECYKCEDAGISYAFFGMVTICIFSYIIYSIKRTIKDMERSKGSKRLQKGKTEIIIKMSADYLNNLACLFSQQINLDIGIDVYMSFITNITNIYSLLYPFDCLLKSLNFTTTSLYIQRMILGSILSIFLPFSAYMYWMIKGFYKKMNFDEKKRKIAITICVICYILQPSIVNSFFSYQNCINFEGKPYLKNQLIERCWENDHILYFLIIVLPLLMMWTVALPSFLLYFMIRNNGKISIESDYKQKVYRFFKKGYKKKYFYWDFILLLRKYCLIILSIFPISEKMLINSFFMSIIIFIFIMFQIFQSPFKSLELNKLALIYNYTLYVTSMCLVLLFNIPPKNFSQIIIIIMMFSNVFFCLLLAYTLFTGEKNIIIDVLKRMKTKMFGENKVFVKIKPIKRKN